MHGRDILLHVPIILLLHCPFHLADAGNFFRISFFCLRISFNHSLGRSNSKGNEREPMVNKLKMLFIFILY